MNRYNRRFYVHQRERSRMSAREIVPLVIDLVGPKSVIDVGCGTGAWLSVFRDHSIEDIHGVDGPWVDRDMLLIPAERFTSADLGRPLPAGREFDLVMSLEVAEHIPSERAGAFVDALAALGPVVLFSAAIPGQGGTHHVNEQWPEYWTAFFAERGYAVIDCIRSEVWHNDRVEWWYAQNILMFVRRDLLDRYPGLRRKLELTRNNQLSLVHPKQYLLAKEQSSAPFHPALTALPRRVKRGVMSLLATFSG
ncbi:methyltransferase domain-containing protein [Geobacter sp. DSM 9736]|uniref:methyltransferase domain-containing protein n=1 Tax=Geobacter sp. DSM 9736 TaxID=1277350 RepID=UPI000B506BDD|nr:methyltransferase domain-containing protein [Geobacter sp. DSM 9736]SNB47967.1 Methyltransferase domain-containing protein [Geobacter sp. DSM 9736]